jgi:hypothetical protein
MMLVGRRYEAARRFGFWVAGLPWIAARRCSSRASAFQSAVELVTSIHPFMTRPGLGLKGLPTFSAMSAAPAQG